MIRTNQWEIFACLGLGLLACMPGRPQSFGTLMFKDKVTLVRKLPAAVHLTGTTIKVRVTGHQDQSDLTHDLQALLETELLKDDSDLRAEEGAASTVVNCQIVSYAHPQPTVSTRPSLAVGKNAPKDQSFTRVTGDLSVSFQAKTSSGQMLSSDNVRAKYDQEFNSAGNSTSGGVMGTMGSAINRIKGGASSEDLNPPTDSELRAKLLQDAVRQIAGHIVNTKETVEVYLAREKGGIDEGDKLAQSGLWQRALEAYETAAPLPKPQEDAYRLYNIGVANEALAYAAEDPKSAMKFLDEAAINYGKAIDAKPTEKYFLEPQKRIETAIAHYRMLEQQKRPVAASASKSAQASAPAKALTNAQIIAMVKAGTEDDTVLTAIRSAKAATFDLSPAGQQELSANGVSAKVLAAMKARAARRAGAGK